MAVEETQAILAGLEGAARNPSLAQVEQVAPYLFLAELIRRAAVMRSQPVHRLGVDSLRPESQPGQGHVLDHPHAQWRHGRLPSLMVRRAISCPPASKGYTQPTHPGFATRTLGEAVPSNTANGASDIPIQGLCGPGDTFVTSDREGYNLGVMKHIAVLTSGGDAPGMNAAKRPGTAMIVNS